jgi:O-Antigen ligase
MRPAALSTARAGLLLGPAVLAFASGGYFPAARLWAAIAAWALLALAALATPGPLLPRSAGARIALAALAGLTIWTAISASWAPAADTADDALQRCLLYLAALAAATLALRDRRAARAAEPVLALGALVVVGYGLSGRLLPGIVHLHASLRAGGRLEQPITYWNATGALAALGLVLSARLAGDRTRARAVRVAAAAAAAPLGMGVYLSFSRAAAAALLAGAVALVLLARTRPQLRATAVALEAAALGAVVAAPFDTVRALAPGHAERDGAIVLALLLAVMALAAGVQAWGAREEARGGVPPGRLRLARRARLATLALLAATAVAPYAAALAQSGAHTAGFGATNSRLSDVGSHRRAYWKVAVQTLADHPLRGAGAGSYGIEWLRRRPIAEVVVNAHSLELETAAELGLVGLALLLATLAGVALAAREALRADPLLAAGPAAACVTWLLHAGIDWDWQVPALSGVAVVLAGLLLGAAEAAAGSAATPRRARPLRARAAPARPRSGSASSRT